MPSSRFPHGLPPERKQRVARPDLDDVRNAGLRKARIPSTKRTALSA